jgi:AcrR family transcriptional regulator
VSRRGYAAVTVDDLARRAHMSLSTVYSLFRGGKEEILLGTYDAGVAQGEAIAMPAYARHAESWPHAVRAAIDALLCYLAGDPAWARMSIVETLAGGDRAMERSDRVIDSYAVLLEPGLERNPSLEPIALEATAGAVYTLIYEQVLSDPTRLCEILPLCTYVALAPFVGPEEALAVANGGERRRARVERS